MSPVISIVLPCFNGAKMLPQSIESCISQTFTDWELIIVNDCSTDDTLEIAKEYAAKDSRILVISNETNMKLPASLNRGFSIARGKYYTWTSDDNMMHLDMLQVLYDYLEEHQDVGLVASNFITADASGKPLYNEPFYEDIQLMLPLNNYIGFSFMYRAAVAKDVGEYDTDLFLVEDYEYWLRIWTKYPVARINDILYTRRLHDASLTATRKKDIAARLVDLRLKYLPVFEERLNGHPKHLALLYNRIVDQKTGQEKMHYLLSFGKKQPISFFLKYIFIHSPHRTYKKLLKKV